MLNIWELNSVNVKNIVGVCLKTNHTFFATIYIELCVLTTCYIRHYKKIKLALMERFIVCVIGLQT